MKSDYQNRQMLSQEEQSFFFPKANPPVTIQAKSREEAEKKLKELQAKKK